MNLVQPKLVRATTKEELMPSYRSFTDLELSSQPNKQLRLTCLAQCEPLCSIDWLLNGKIISIEELIETGQWLSSSNEQVFYETRRAKLESLELFQLNNVIRVPSSTEARKFSWTKQSTWSFSLNNSQVVRLNQHQLASEQLARVSQETSDALDANVLSKFEINYNQLIQVLAASKMNDSSDGLLSVECKLSKLLDQQFGYAHVPPNVWFPTQQSSKLLDVSGYKNNNDNDVDSEDDKDGDDDYVVQNESLHKSKDVSANESEISLSNEPLDLGSLFGGAPKTGEELDLMQTKLVLKSKCLSQLAH